MKKEWVFMVLWFAVSSFMVQNFWKTDVTKPLPTTSKQIQRTNSEQQMEQQGLVDIKSIDPTIKVALMYSRTDNFCHKQLYKSLRKAYMLPQCAAALKKTQAELRQIRPDLSLIIFDATRPMSVQQTMWNAVKNTNHSFYVSNPANGGGMHNYGMAVDISLCKSSWNEKQWRDGTTVCKIDTIPMGTKVDYMGNKSHIDKEQQLLMQGALTKETLENRKLLRHVMTFAGFQPLRTEWWHFNLCTRAWAKAHLKVIK